MNTTSSGLKNPKWTSRTGAAKNHQGADATGSLRSATALETVPRRTRIIIADSEAIFRVGMSQIFAEWKDLEVGGPDRNPAADPASRRHLPADVILFEVGLAPNPPTPLAR